MSDREIRALERLAAEGGVADAVALLRARVRAGLVPQNCVDLAARLGDEVAGACATPCLAPMAWGHVSRVEALSALPSRVALGLALDWAAAALPIWEAAFDDGRPRSALSAARALVAAPSATTRDAARAAPPATKGAPALPPERPAGRRPSGPDQGDEARAKPLPSGGPDQGQAPPVEPMPPGAAPANAGPIALTLDPRARTVTFLGTTLTPFKAGATWERLVRLAKRRKGRPEGGWIQDLAGRNGVREDVARRTLREALVEKLREARLGLDLVGRILSSGESEGIRLLAVPVILGE